MAAEQQIAAQLELRITAPDWRRLQAHLFPGDEDEHGAVLLCGWASSARSQRLLVREVVLAEDGISYVPGVRGYRQLTGHFVTQMIRRARDEKLVYLAVHNHGGKNSVRFSAADLRSHERGYPTLLGLTKQPVGAIVLADGAVAGDIWISTRTRKPLARTVIIGSSPSTLGSEPPSSAVITDARYSRQTLLYGSEGQSILRQSKVGIVGAGGVGMLIIQALARLGVGHLVVIDPDNVDPTNLPRLPETTRLDAMIWLNNPGLPARLQKLGKRMARPKASVARRIARRANRRIIIEAIKGNIADDTTAKLLTDCDFIFLAADTMLARDIVNQLAYQYLIPTLQIGSKAVISPETRSVLDTFSVVRTLGPQRGCLRCNGLIDLHRLGEEALGDPEQILNQRYIDDPGVHAPSVIALNAMGAGWGVNSYMQYAVGLTSLIEGFHILRTAPISDSHPLITVQIPAVVPDCHVCGHESYSAFAQGDQQDLPTRL
jgi:ThiF family